VELLVIDEERTRLDGVCSMSVSFATILDDRRRFKVFDADSSSITAMESTAEAIYK
jgi:hypothetical protein